MDKEKQIKEMTAVVDNVQTFGTKYYPDKYEPWERRVDNDEIATEFYYAGYRNQNETAQEIWDDCIDKIMRGCGDDKEFWVMKILIETFKKYRVGFEDDDDRYDCFGPQ